MQQLAELEEIILHKAAPHSMPLDLLVRMWRGRLSQAQLDADVWQEVLAVRYLVAPPARDVRTWLKFGSLCRKSGRGALAHKILVEVLGTDPALVPRPELPAMQPAVCFAYVKQLWDNGARLQPLTTPLGYTPQLHPIGARHELHPLATPLGYTP